MQPCWTLMGVSDAIPGIRSWDMARPEPGALAMVLRNESRPGREARRDEVHWVLHAKAGWSRAHVDQEPAWIASAMQQALPEWLGAPLRWRTPWRTVGAMRNLKLAGIRPHRAAGGTRAFAWAYAATFSAAGVSRAHGAPHSRSPRQCRARQPAVTKETALAKEEFGL